MLTIDQLFKLFNMLNFFLNDITQSFQPKPSNLKVYCSWLIPVSINFFTSGNCNLAKAISCASALAVKKATVDA